MASLAGIGNVALELDRECVQAFARHGLDVCHGIPPVLSRPCWSLTQRSRRLRSMLQLNEPQRTTGYVRRQRRVNGSPGEL
jgi:hypothetical protein